MNNDKVVHFQNNHVHARIYLDKLVTCAIKYSTAIEICNLLESIAVFKMLIVHPFYSNSVIAYPGEKKKSVFNLIKRAKQSF